MEPSASWPEPLLDARLTLVIGETDTGKTSLVTRLASDLVGRGLTVAIVDADVGQSEIGPPTTIGLGRATGALARLGEAEVVALHFVGATSPAGNLLGTVVGTRRMVDRARADGVDRVLVDTSGLVGGDLGQALKHAKIDLVEPDALVALQRAGECEPILRRYAVGGPAVVRLAVPAGVRRRPSEERRLYRQRALDAWLAGARRLELDLARVVLQPDPPGGDLAGTLVGLDDAARRTLGIGRVLALDAGRGRLTVETRVDPGAVAAVTLGRERYPA